MSSAVARINVDAFVPRRGLCNGHLQTLAGNFLPRKNYLPQPEERLFQIEKEIQILCYCDWQSDRTKCLTLIIVHGLEGSSSSQYVIGTGSKAWLAGMNVVRMNMRNCGGTDNLATSLYHSGLSDDVGEVLRTLVASDGLSRIALAGFSMGGNLVLKLVGELGAGAPSQLRAVAAVSPVIDLAISSDALHHWKNRIYELRFLAGLKRRFKRKTLLFPNRYKAMNMRSMRSVRDFDHMVTAPYSGFTGADDYYERASSSQVIGNIAIPALIIHSTDDPFIRVSPETRNKLFSNPSITYIETPHGGHCAFLASPKGYDGRWAERSVIQFVSQF